MVDLLTPSNLANCAGERIGGKADRIASLLNALLMFSNVTRSTRPTNASMPYTQKSQMNYWRLKCWGIGNLNYKDYRLVWVSKCLKRETSGEMLAGLALFNATLYRLCNHMHRLRSLA